MGGPTRAQFPQSSGEQSPTVQQRSRLLNSARLAAHFYSGHGVGVGPSARSGARGGSRGEQDGQTSASIPTPSHIPQLDVSIHDSLIDESMQEVLSNVDSSRGLMGPPTMAASQRPTLAGSLSSRKPNLHLSLGEPSQTMSRFSAFSSNEGTPSGDSMRRGNSTQDSPSFSRAGSSPTVSIAASSTAGTPCTTDSALMAALGDNSILSPRALYDFGALSTSSSQSLSSIIASNHSNSIAPLPSTSNLPPQTPDRHHTSSLESSYSSLQTPARSPSNTYDRAGQIGIGELSTPRWTSNMTTRGWPSDAEKSFKTSTGGPVDSTPNNQRHTSDGEARHARAISFSATAPLQPRQSGSGAAIHTAVPSSMTPSSYREGHHAMVSSPSMPSYGPSLGGVSSLATLAHHFHDNEERERAVKKSRQSGDTDSTSRAEADTPDYSINAMSESEDEAISGQTAHKSMGSSRIGDTAWSEGETGPFAVASSSSQSGTVVAEERPRKRGESPRFSAREIATSSDDTGMGDQGFDLNAAIAELNSVEEARRRARRAVGLDTDMGASSVRSSGEHTLHHQNRDDSAPETTPHRIALNRKSQGSEKERNNEMSLTSARRLRRTSSPSVAKTTTSMARLPSSSSVQSISSGKKRSSSASIGHSLLRGSLPLGASEEYEGILTGGEGDATAEELRMLDGVGATRRGSMGRDRELSKSPRSSKQLARPTSAGRRTPGASRTSSPTNKHRDSTYSSRQQREEALGTAKGSTSARRTSRSLGKVKNADEATASPPTIPLDNSKRLSYSSPRIKRTALPPLPSHSVPMIASPSMSSANLSASIGSNTSDQQRIKDASRRASGASIASSNVSANRSLAATTARSNRTSETSMLDVPSSGAANSNLGLGLAAADDKAGGVPSASPSMSSLNVPPVPPLPKAWEGTRTISLHSMENNSTQMNTSISSGSFVSANQQPAPPSIESAEAATPPIVTKKWSFTNLGGPLSSKKSEEKLIGRKNVAAGLSSPSTTSAHIAPIDDYDKSTSSDRQPSITNGGFHQSPDGSMSQSSLQSPVSRRDQVGVASSDGAVAPTPVTAMAKPEAFPSPSVATFRNRRTPSFFRKRSSDALADQTTSSVYSGHDKQGTTTSLASQDSSDKDKSRAEITTPSSGRSSRKSILGIGSMLRNASKRNIDTMPTSIPASASIDKSNGHEAHEESTDSPGRVTSAPRIPSLKNLRRTSVIGRKRGKTLPSSTDSTASKGATTTTSNQGMPAAISPSSSTSSRPPTESVMSTLSANRSAETPSKRRLNSPASRGDLSASTSQEKINVETVTQQQQLPTILASPFAKPSSLYMERDVSVDGSLRRNTDALPASRIPRATTYGSIRRNNQPQQSSAQSVVATPATTPATKRTVGTPSSTLSSSKTAFSLASNLGIAPDGEDKSASSSSLGSSALISILNAYTNAKTPAEVEVVIRRARVASHSSTTSARDKEVLVSLVSRQEQKKQAESGIDATSGQRPPSETNYNTPLSKTPKAGESHRINSALSSSSNGHIPVSGGSSSVPRRPRISMTATANSLRAAREANNAMSASKISYRLSATPTHTHQSTALPDVVSAPTLAQDSPTPSPPVEVPVQTNDEEREGDEEMEAYIKRRHQRKVAQGAKLADLEKTLQFPEDEPPARCYSYRQAEAMWGDKLTDLEMEEMRSFKEIYFVGHNVDKRARLHAENASANNMGYDDERGDYLVINHDHLAYRYEVTNLLGRGSFGQVLQCKDHKTGKSVAIKLIRNKKRFHHQALVEVKILENLVQWDPNDEHNVIKILDSFYFRNHLCISMEMLSINLYELIKANSFVGFSTKLIRRLTSQVLASLTLLRKNRVVHCDLKPENILLMHPRKSAIKVIDFGSSCFEHEKVYTYIQSRFYRSPEVILGMNYHTAIDIWSLACIMAELYSGYPLFPGENEQEQLACIMEILGPPDRYLIEKSSRKKLFFDSTGAPRPVVNSKGRRRRPSTKTLSSALNCSDDLFLDFLTKCLHWDPDKRLKPEAALRHPWIKRGSEAASIQSSTKPPGQFSSSATLSNISGPTSRRAMFSSMTSASSSASLSKSVSSAIKPLNISSQHGGNAKSALAASQGASRSSNTALINPAVSKPARSERRISLRNSLNPNASTSSPLRSAARSHQQPVS